MRGLGYARSPMSEAPAAPLTTTTI